MELHEDFRPVLSLNAKYHPFGVVMRSASLLKRRARFDCAGIYLMMKPRHTAVKTA